MVLLFFAIQLYQKMRTFAICNRPHFSLLGLLFCYSPFFIQKRTPHTVQRPFLYPSNALLSRAAARQVSSAPQSLTTVFGMGTGVSSASLSLSYQIRLFSPNTFSTRFLRADLTYLALSALYPVCLRILSRYSFQFFPWSSPRPISITQLNTLLHLHL